MPLRAKCIKHTKLLFCSCFTLMPLRAKCIKHTKLLFCSCFTLMPLRAMCIKHKTQLSQLLESTSGLCGCIHTPLSSVALLLLSLLSALCSLCSLSCSLALSSGVRTEQKAGSETYQQGCIGTASGCTSDNRKKRESVLFFIFFCVVEIIGGLWSPFVVTF